jgi:ferritin heavy chain
MPSKATWLSAEEAVKDAVHLEKELNVKLHNIHKNADRICADPHLMDFLETEFLEEQIASIRQLNKLLTSLTSFEKENRQMGEYLVDKQLLDEKSRKYFEEEL